MTYGTAQTTGNDRSQKDAYQHNKTWWGYYAAAGVGISKTIKSYYDKYLTGVDKSEYYAASLKNVYGQTFSRIDQLQFQVKNIYVQEKKKIDKIVIEMSRIGVTNNYYNQLYVSQWFAEVPFNPLDKELVDLAVSGTDKAYSAYGKRLIKKYGIPSNYQPKYGTLAERLLTNRLGEIAKLNTTIINGLRSGDAPQKIVKGILDVIGRRTVSTKGKEIVSGARANTWKIVRTESTRLLNAGRFAQSQYAQSIGLDIQKQWDATLSGNTREAHGNLDGKRIGLDKAFSIGNDRALYPGDFSLTKNNVNCRCHYFEILPETDLKTRRGRDPITGKVNDVSFTQFNQWAKDNNLVRNKSGLLVLR